jgi:glycosyltransferase involved in cell wall biosynthesis
LRAALQSGADVIVTLDADGQHLPEEIPRVVAPVLNGTADVVIGCRLLNHKGMPLLRVVANRIADACTWLLFGVYLSDTQSGFRAYSRTAAQSIDIRTSGMEVCSEIIVLAVRSGLRVAQVPITPVYTDYSLSKGQSFYNGIRTLAKLVLRRIL